MIVNLSCTDNNLVMLSDRPILTTGMQELCYCKPVFSAAWNGLQKVATFYASKLGKEISKISIAQADWNEDGSITLPPEVVAVPADAVYIGIIGADAAGVVIPTVWCRLNKVVPGADDDGSNTELTPETWAKVLEAIGDPADLETEDKSSLVAAINEARRGGSLYVEYGAFNDWNKISKAVEEKKPVFCFKFDSISYSTILYRLVYAISDQYIFTCEYTSTIDFVYANKEGNGITWTDERLPIVRKHLPETEGNAYFTANGSHYGSAKYVGVLFDNSDVDSADLPALASNAEDPRIKMHGGSRNVDIMATTAEDGKNAVEFLGDNKKNNVYVGGVLAPRNNKPHDVANKEYVDSRIIPFTVTLSYDAWETVEGETDEDTTYKQTVEAPELHDIYANENANVTLCPSPSNVAAWTNYGMICTDVTVGNGEGNGTFTFLSKTHPSTNESITLNIVLVR